MDAIDVLDLIQDNDFLIIKLNQGWSVSCQIIQN